jgi:endonuclease/exonuclease/phosphatase (EEP) superfamily protein YafD
VNEARPSRGEDPRDPRAVGAEEVVLFQVTEATFREMVGWLGRGLDWVTAAYVVSLCLFLLGMEWWGERFWLFSVINYGPIQVCLVPLVFLTPVCLLFRRGLVLWHLLAAFLLIFCYMRFRWSSIPAFRSSEVRAVTFNYGESNRAQFLGFLTAEKPDLLVMQDARGRAADLVKLFPDMYGVDLDQFAFLSKFPIQEAAIVESVKVQGQSVMARYEVMIQGRRVAVYSVHLPTPRQQLARFLGGRRILGDFVGHGYQRALYGNYRDWLRERMQLAHTVARVLADEKLPMIVGGDFNTPDHGYIYHLFAGEMTDAFAHAGRGWGLTFPGSTHNPISFFGPWLRIDYFFAGHGWNVLECRPEPGGKSQHKAVFARFEPRSLN